MMAPTLDTVIPDKLESPFRHLFKLAQTTVVTAGLCGVAFWGHKTDWTFRPEHKAISPGGSSASAKVTSDADGSATVAFSTVEEAEVAGIEAAPVWQTAMAETLAIDGDIAFDPDRVVRVPARAGGLCIRVFKKVGDLVHTGDLLAMIDSAEVGKAKAALLQRTVQLRSKRRILSELAEGGDGVSTRQRSVAQADVREAELKCLAAEQELATLGIVIKTEDLIGLPADAAAGKLRTLGVKEANESTNLLPVRSPADGVLLEVNISNGEVVSSGQELFLVVDPYRVRLTLHVPESQSRRVEIGQPVLFRQDGSMTEIEGVLTWLGSAVDSATRTLPARADLINVRGELRANTLGRGRIVLRNAPNALTVPNTALHSLNTQSVVFVRDRDYIKDGGPKSFRLRAVRVGTVDGANTEILAGLSVGEVVATRGSTFLLNEVRRSRAETTGGSP